MKKSLLSYILIGINILVLVILAGCSQDQGLLPKQDKGLVDRIVFFSDRDPNGKIYSMSPDGKDITQITFNIPSNIQINSLTWSTAAQKWAFTGVNNGTADIYVASQDGKIVQDITNTPTFYEDDPAISPDGKLIAYTVSEGGKNTAVVTSLIDGTKVTRVSQFPLVEVSPVWMQDNKNLLMTSSKEGSPNIFMVGMDGSNLINLSNGKGLDENFSLAENNSIMVFVSDRDGGRKVFGYDFKKKEITPLTTAEMGICTSPKVSPDGTKVVFRSDKDGGTDLYVLTIGDKSLIRLTETPNSTKWTFNWSPDGKKVYFTSDNNGQLDIFLTDIESKQTLNLTNNPANDYTPLWIRIRE